jgi:hypothetical protein
MRPAEYNSQFFLVNALQRRKALRLLNSRVRGFRQGGATQIASILSIRDALLQTLDKSNERDEVQAVKVRPGGGGRAPETVS